MISANDQNGHLAGLLAHHVARLRASGLSDATIQAAGLRSETSPEKLAVLLGWRKPTKGLAPAIVIPYVGSDGANGYYRVRPDSPRNIKGKPIKYESPRGQPNRVYYPPGTLRALEDANTEILITEGEWKALAATQTAGPCIGLVGVYGWKEKSNERLLPELERITWAGRQVRIIFDSDITLKPEVHAAERRLAKHLGDRGAIVKCVRLPDGPPGDDGKASKLGVDDFIVAHGAGELRKLIDAAIEPEAVEAAENKAHASTIDPGDEARAYLATLMQDGLPRLRYWHDTPFFWERGAYRRRQSHEARADVLRYLDRGHFGLKSGTVSCVLDHVKAYSILRSDIEPGTWLDDASCDWPANEILATPDQLIHLPRLVAGKPDFTRPATPKLFTTAALDFGFNLGALRPVHWLAFLSQLWQDDEQSASTLQEQIGYLLTPDTTHQKIGLFVGPRRSGKGTIGRVIRELVGHANVVGPTLASLATNFGLESLLGKSVAIVSDARLSGRTDSAIVIERLLSISGEDCLTIDRKHEKAITCKLPTRIILLTNELPRLSDSSGALASRFIVLRLSQSFYGKEDRLLFAKLRPELPGILLWAIEGWRRLRDRGYFVQPAAGESLAGEMADLTSPIGAFVREECTVDAAAEISRASLYAAYRTWAESKGRDHVEDEVGFGRGLRAAVATISDVAHRVDGKRARYYTGIRLN